ncbi:MAG: VOC family protein [Cyclobacteriaceae bacterium]|nr:VOC family protein [Cyclobacteriaceae bacterium]
MKKNIAGWFEIPVTDIDRAMRFYEKVFGLKLTRNQLGDLDMAWFPEADNGIGSPGSLMKHEGFYKPSHDGVMLYLNSQTDDLNDELSRVERAGGKILKFKTEITPEIGHMGLIEDTEGNRIGLFSKL